jgi:hypothetical protein
MKKSILLFLIVCAAAIFSNVAAQQETPAGAGDKSLRDESIRMRSIDLERAKRDADKSKSASSPGVTASINTDIDKKYPQIKEDFEGIQNNQAAIIKAYTTGESIDYKQIRNSADEINKRAKRLDENLFVEKAEEKKAEPKENGDKKTKEIKELIVELDNAIGDFTTSPMFQNLRVVSPEVAGKTQVDLAKIMEISKILSKEADKMK